MTRRDYVFIAEVFNRMMNSDTPLLRDERRGIELSARGMSYALHQANPRFDEDMFLRNAGVVTTTDNCAIAQR
jgi:hypothetical protein